MPLTLAVIAGGQAAGHCRQRGGAQQHQCAGHLGVVPGQTGCAKKNGDGIICELLNPHSGANVHALAS